MLPLETAKPLLLEFTASVPELSLIDWKLHEHIGFLIANEDLPINRRATNAAIKKVHSAFDKERYSDGRPTSSPDYLVEFKGHIVFFQYDNHDRCYAQISVLDTVEEWAKLTERN